MSALTLMNCWINSAADAKLLQSCPTLCDPIDSSPPGSPVPGILQARTLEWVAISFSNAWKWKLKVKSLSGVQLIASSWTAAYQAPPPMGFSRQEYWSGVPLPSPVVADTNLQTSVIWRESKLPLCLRHWNERFSFSLKYALLTALLSFIFFFQIKINKAAMVHIYNGVLLSH